MTRRLLAAAALAVLASAARAANPAEVLELPQVEVVGTTTLPGSDVPLAKLPANAQIFTSRDLRNQRPGNLTEFLDQNGTGITLNSAQGNPYQPDLNLRGFTASPLLGTPQGLSVFFDGVRINEPFGDAVNWDLIPAIAISSIQLVPGSQPAFGLNTLGGAVAIYSKSGASAYPLKPGAAIALSGGSFGRRTLTAETGGRDGRWDWYAAANDAEDAGWADHNPSRVRQLFGKLGWQDERTDVDLSFGGANNRLAGTQTLPVSFENVRAAYTYPDQNANRAGHVTLKGSHAVSDTWLVSGLAYLRQFRNRNFSSNITAEADGAAAPATNDVSVIDQTGSGAGLQLTHRGTLAGLRHQLSIGTSLDWGRAHYVHTAQDAAFAADRGTLGLTPFATVTDAGSSTRHLGAFVSDSIDLDARWTLQLAGRYNRADVRIEDRSGLNPALDGAHRFGRFNPALGLSFNPRPAVTLYASYNEGMRTPTAIELTCADPAAPCQLPNSFLADPPLKPVVSRTVEAGARGRLGSNASWSAAIFRTDLADDLQFVSSNGASLNAGYFQNVGTTRRQGLELGGNARLDAVELSVHYSFIDARFRDPFVESSPNHSGADASGAITVAAGDRIPSIPRHALKLRAQWSVTDAWSVALAGQFAGAVPARGDENNADAGGTVPGWGVVNLDTHLRTGAGWQWFARVDNLFDRRYANFGILGENFFAGPTHTFDPAQTRREQFRGYGATRGIWIGAELAWP